MFQGKRKTNRVFLFLNILKRFWGGQNIKSILVQFFLMNMEVTITQFSLYQSFDKNYDVPKLEIIKNKGVTKFFHHRTHKTLQELQS